MARKEDKLRPYRVDYFNIDEMKEVDQALVQSVVVRAVTAAEAAGKVLTDNETLPLVLIRSYRFYKTLGPRVKNVYKAVEDLFTAKQAIIVMGEVEKYRTQLAAPPVTPVATPATPGAHVTRYSDSSLYDEVCVNCGATDASGNLDQPCPSAAPTTGPNSPATVSVVADLQGMIAHDAHEQTMDTFVPTNVPDGKRFPDPTNTAPITSFVQPEALIEPDQAVGTAGRPTYLNDPMPGAPQASFQSLAAKIVVFGGVLLIVIYAISKLLHH